MATLQVSYCPMTTGFIILHSLGALRYRFNVDYTPLYLEIA